MELPSCLNGQWEMVGDEAAEAARVFSNKQLIKPKGPFIKEAAAAEGPLAFHIALPSGALHWACAQGSIRSRPSANTHPELWFANEKWMANTIHELCSCHGDINQKQASPLGLEQCVCGIKMHGGELLSLPRRPGEPAPEPPRNIASAS